MPCPLASSVTLAYPKKYFVNDINPYLPTDNHYMVSNENMHAMLPPLGLSLVF